MSPPTHFVRSKNLSFSLEGVKKCCSNCDTCAEVKPQFLKPDHHALVKATQPMERLNVDFKGPLPSVSKNCFFLCIVDEYSRYPFCFPCPDTSAATVISCLETLFSLFGTCNFIHSDRGSFFPDVLRNICCKRGLHRATPHPIIRRGTPSARDIMGLSGSVSNVLWSLEDSKWENGKVCYQQY